MNFVSEKLNLLVSIPLGLVIWQNITVSEVFSFGMFENSILRVLCEHSSKYPLAHFCVQGFETRLITIIDQIIYIGMEFRYHTVKRKCRFVFFAISLIEHYVLSRIHKYKNLGKEIVVVNLKLLYLEEVI